MIMHYLTQIVAKTLSSVLMFVSVGTTESILKLDGDGNSF